MDRENYDSYEKERYDKRTPKDSTNKELMKTYVEKEKENKSDTIAQITFRDKEGSRESPTFDRNVIEDYKKELKMKR